MKTKITLLLVLGALFGVFGVQQAFAQSLVIDSIKKSLENDMEPIGPIEPGTKIYFDVKLVDAPTGGVLPFEITDNEYVPGVAGERPYLMLNIPFKGVSSKADLSTLEATEAKEVSTDYAVAFYDGQKDGYPDTLRFVYTVRPGDMAESLTWRTKDGTDATAPVFGGALDKVHVKVERGALESSTLDLSSKWLSNVVVGDGKTYTISGYTMTVGDAGDNNEGMVYQGLVPVTVTTDGNVGAAAPWQTTAQKKYSFWVMVDDGGTWKYLSVPVTHMPPNVDNVPVNAVGLTSPDYADLVVDAFPASPYMATYNVPTSASTSYMAQRFFVNIPDSVPADTTIRLCYGIKPGTPNAVANYTYIETTVTASPVQASASAVESYSLMASQGMSVSDGTETNPHSISLAAGKSSTLTIEKPALNTMYGKLYGVLEKLTTPAPTGGAINAKLERYYVEMNPFADPNNPYSVKLSVAASAGAGEGMYRVRIPGTVDTPLYFKLVTSTESVTINLVPTEVGTSGSEYFNPLDTTGAAGTLSVLPVDLVVPAGEMRTFKIFPVASDNKTEILESALTDDGIKLHDLIAGFATVQANEGVNPNPETASPSAIVTVPEGETTVRFYVVCRNDYPNTKSLLYGKKATQNGASITLSGVIFKAARCDASGKVTGTNDICTRAIAPAVANRAPVITTANNNSAGKGVGAAINFNFAVADSVSDYLIAQMVYGDGTTETFLYVDEAKMKKMMGDAGWASELAALKISYPDLAKDGAVKNRLTELQTLSFAHTYNQSGATWTFTVYDSSGASASTMGMIALTKAQLFTFYTWDNATRPATGYVNWADDTVKPGEAGYQWSFGETYTYASKTLDSGNSVRVKAYPFTAGTTAPTNYGTISTDLDSFFYRWGTRDSKFDALLPKEEYHYYDTLEINRAFVGELGGDASDPTKWSDITLAALFVSEKYWGDALEAYSTSLTNTLENPYLYNFGDYNQDGVPDGWLLNGQDSSTARTMIEGSDISMQQAEGDGLPLAGWEAGDAAYGIASNAKNNNVMNGSTVPGAAFTYKMRVRGRDNALNAATGDKDDIRWLSQPAWVVLIRPEVKVQGKNEELHDNVQPWLDANVANPNEKDALFPAVRVNAPRQQVRLLDPTTLDEVSDSERLDIAFTPEQKIPYWTGLAGGQTWPDAEGWAPVVDWMGRPVYGRASDWDTAAEKASPAYATEPYTTNRVFVNVNEEVFKTEYDRWVVLEPADPGINSSIRKPKWKIPQVLDRTGALVQDYEDGTLFPFLTKVDMQNAHYEKRAPKSDGSEGTVAVPDTTKMLRDWEWTGAIVQGTGIASLDGTYAFTDERTPEGILQDEYINEGWRRTSDGRMDPRMASWLERFPIAKGADTDGDGIRNGAEYFFWYYASRKGYISAYCTEEVQYERVNGIVQAQKYADGSEVTVKYGQVNNELWPAIDIRNKKNVNKDSDYGLEDTFVMGRAYNYAYDPEKGNLWTPIPVETVLSAFNMNASVDADPDQDGLNTAEEILLGSNPVDFDSDGDGVPDGWARAYGLDPTAGAGGQNPDNDYFAVASVNVYSDYHHFFLVESYDETVFGPTSGDSRWPTETRAATDDEKAAEVGRETFVEPVKGDLYYDYEGDCFWVFHEKMTDEEKRYAFEGLSRKWDDINHTLVCKTSYTREDFKFITAWAPQNDDLTTIPNPLYVKMSPVRKEIRDEEVYQTFGFSPFTAWGDDLGDAMGRARFSMKHTKAFTTVEEFKSAVRRCRRYRDVDDVDPGLPNDIGLVRRYSTSPTNNDTDGDGLPDGWELYVGFSRNTSGQDGDGLSPAEEFQCVAVNKLIAAYKDFGTPPEGWNHLFAEKHEEGGWTNKLFPTDPRNPDSDFDGIWDDMEGDPRYIYQPMIVKVEKDDGESEESMSDLSVVTGGGGDPNAMDTDGDGMPDGWEYRYGSPLVLTTMTRTADEEGNVTETKTQTMNTDIASILDLTSPYDAGLDIDCDGLPNIQEYWTGLLRQNRYDLSPEHARLHGDKQGKRLNSGEWLELPDVYVATEDLVNPQASYSIDYVGETVDPLRRAFGSMSGVEVPPPKETPSFKYDDDVLDPAIRQAVNHQWGQTIMIPTAAQVTTYMLGVDANFSRLQEAIREFDAAYMRSKGTSYTTRTPEWSNCTTMTLEKNDVRDNRQLIALATRIDMLIGDLQKYSSEGTCLMNEAVCSLFTNGDVQRIWDVRKSQVLGGKDVDGAYDGMTTRVKLAAEDGATSLPTWTAPAMPEVLAKASAYEEIVRETNRPLILSQYRAALRGYAGALWYTLGQYRYGETSDSFYKYYIGQVGLHRPILPLYIPTEKGNTYARAYYLGSPISTVTLGAKLGKVWGGPYNTVVTYRSDFFTTSPLCADSDGDGMDDYWEVYHGINPLLGDYRNLSYATAKGLEISRAGYLEDHLQSAYLLNGSAYGIGLDMITPENNAFSMMMGMMQTAVKTPLTLEAATGYDYYSYPWMAGAPFADPDGDGLLNFEEAVNPSGGVPAHYGTDPSPLWMTDPNNPHSFVSRFYTRLNANTDLPVEIYDENGHILNLTQGISYSAVQPLTYVVPRALTLSTTSVGNLTAPLETTDSLLPYEVNEGFDTDGDGTPDNTELASNVISRGDPQSLATPDREQAAFFGGKGAMQSQALTQFGPTSLTTFTIECWVNPSDLVAAGAPVAGSVSETTPYEMILIDRPWSVMDGTLASDSIFAGATRESLRHNFTLGLRAIAKDKFVPFVRFTGAGTTNEGTATLVPQASPEVFGGEGINAETWTHLAATYNGSTLAIYVNGTQVSAESVTLIPANGVIALKNDELDSLRSYTYRKAPILIGAGPGDAWFADLMDATAYTELTAEDAFQENPTGGAAFANCYYGYIDEVRIWNGALTSERISTNRSRVLTQTELLENRLDVFTYRYRNGGYFAKNVPAELLAFYTFSDLLSSTRDEEMKGLNEPWERYPGQQLIGDETIAGSFLYRRKGLEETKAILATLDVGTDPIYPVLPTISDIYSSYYSTLVHPKLQSKQYYMYGPDDGVTMTTYTATSIEARDDSGRLIPVMDKETGLQAVDENGNPVWEMMTILIPETTPSYATEAVPMAHNRISHLPLMDVAFANIGSNLFFVRDISGATSLKFPSGTPENLKAPDSVYWTPHAAGDNVTAEARFDVKTTGNPYGYSYVATTTFDALNFKGVSSYRTMMGTDLLIYGDVFAKYTYESWDNAPSTDPNAGSSVSPTDPVEGSMSWFEYNSGNGNSLLNQQFSNGAAYFEGLFPNQTKDSDGDQMPNWWENYYGLDPEDPLGANGPHGDDDGDFLTNYAEFLATSNPKKYSTAGNGVPDYHMPIWARRGRPTFGLLYTDNDFMEDHWEVKYLNLSTDLHDPTGDRDGDGWSNWAEARAMLRGVHSTDPNDFQENLVTGIAASYPTPTLQIEVDYFGPMSGMTNATNNIVIHTYTAKNNNSAPDAVFSVPMGVSSSGESELTQLVGMATLDRTVTGYLRPGNIRPGTLTFLTYCYIPVSGDPKDGSTGGMELGTSWFVRDNTKGELIAVMYRDVVNPETEETKTEQSELVIGSIDYRTGAYSYCFSSKNWSGLLMNADGSGMTDFSNVYLQARYTTQYAAGFPAKFTLSSPITGHIREGINNFFVFMDLDGDGSWDANEPAGVPDQHDVDIGFDTINQVLHVELTPSAPPGAIRFDVGRILQALSDHVKLAEEQIRDSQNNPGSTTDDLLTTTATTSVSVLQPLDPEQSTIPHPTIPEKFLNPKYFALSEPYRLIVQEYQSIAPGNVVSDANAKVYEKEYNVKKPYITEDEIFAQNPMGLGGSESNTLIASSYLVSLVPLSAGEDWSEYNLGLVTNVVGTLDHDLTKMVSPIGGWVFHNNEITFEWLSTVQAVQMNLVINKTHDAHGVKLATPIKIYDKSIRGVSANQQMTGDGAMEQFLYSYTLPRGIGELSDVKSSVLFGDGLYAYSLTLIPYAQQQKQTLSGNFAIQLNASGDPELKEVANTEDETFKDTSYNAQDSYYVRTRVRYNGVLSETEDFDTRNIIIEAHRSASFNGDPVAAVSDVLVYDAEGLADYEGVAYANYNRCVKMVKDKTYKASTTTAEKLDFFSTRFDAEIRGFKTNDPVYLIAYFDLNGNGKRDMWEPWGYATMGTDDAEGYYFDARSVTPVRGGTDYLAEFYIQDVDTDNDKLADTWEWRSAGFPTNAFDTWCATFTGGLVDHIGTAGAKESDIWTTSEAGTVALTAYGAQLYGLTASGAPDANGAVTVDGLPEDGEVARDLINLIGQDKALELFAEGYDLYDLTIKSMVMDASGSLTFEWGVTASTSVETGRTEDLTEVFAGTALTDAAYTIYAKASITDTAWVKIADVKLCGNEPTLTLDAETAKISVDGEEKSAQFFKVILSLKPAQMVINEP